MPAAPSTAAEKLARRTRLSAAPHEAAHRADMPTVIGMRRHDARAAQILGAREDRLNAPCGSPA